MKLKLLKDIGTLMASTVIQIDDPSQGFKSIDPAVADQVMLINHLLFNHRDEYFADVTPPKPKSVWNLQPQDECYSIATGFVFKATWFNSQQDNFLRDAWSIFLTEEEATSVLLGRQMKAQAEKRISI